MSLLWADSFDHYPDGRSSVPTSGSWARFDGVISTTFARTGTKSCKIGFGNEAIRRTLGSPKTTVGAGMSIYFIRLPSNSNNFHFYINDTLNNTILDFNFASDGSLQIFKGSTLIDVIDGAIVAGSFIHIEIKAVIDPLVGEIEVRLNGITALLLTDLNTGSVPTTQVSWQHTDSGIDEIYIDDVFAWDDLGVANNSFLGPQRILTIFPAATTNPNDWLLTGAASKVAAISEVGPDGDTSYISAGSVGTKQTFTLPTLPPELFAIAAVYVVPMTKIDSAGEGGMSTAMLSGASADTKNSVALTTTYVYYGNAFDLNPDGNVPWTKATLEAAKVQFNKTI